MVCKNDPREASTQVIHIIPIAIGYYADQTRKSALVGHLLCLFLNFPPNEVQTASRSPNSLMTREGPHSRAHLVQSTPLHSPAPTVRVSEHGGAGGKSSVCPMFVRLTHALFFHVYSFISCLMIFFSVLCCLEPERQRRKKHLFVPSLLERLLARGRGKSFRNRTLNFLLQYASCSVRRCSNCAFSSQAAARHYRFQRKPYLTLSMHNGELENFCLLWAGEGGRGRRFAAHLCFMHM